MDKRRKVVIDCDPGVDDVLGLCLALTSPELEILAITLCFGNTDVDSEYLNVLKLYHQIDQHLKENPDDRKRFVNFVTIEDEESGNGKRPYLVKGAEGPVEGSKHKAEYFHGKDGLSDITTRFPNLTPKEFETLEGIESLHERYFRPTTSTVPCLVQALISEYPVKSITCIYLGPLTNLSHIVRSNPQPLRDLNHIMVMGGALDVPGNTSPAAEFNVFADPFAAKEIFDWIKFERDVPDFLLIPLDVTSHHSLSFDLFEIQVEIQKNRIAEFWKSIFQRLKEVMKLYGGNGMELHDPCVVWASIFYDPTSPDWSTKIRQFEIERTGELTRGMCLVDRRQSIEHEGEIMKNRSLAQESNQIEKSIENNVQGGIKILIETPGETSIVDLLLERVWGIKK